MIELRSQDVPGRVAIVTGGTQGIGKEIARGLVEQNVHVVLAARDAQIGEKAAAELSPDGSLARFHRLDLFDKATLEDLAKFVEKTYGRLDILVNNAAVGIPPKPAFEVTADQMRWVYEANVFAVVAIIERLLPLLTAAPAGRIVNVSSERGTLSTPRVAYSAPPNMAYSSSKSALNAVTQQFAYSFDQAKLRIKINAAAPGHCATAFNGFRGKRTPAEGARIAIALALIDGAGPQGGFFHDEGPAPW